MSSINVARIIEKSPGSRNFSATYYFKLHPDAKEKFLELCQEKNLSPGNVLRELLDEFLAGVENAGI